MIASLEKLIRERWDTMCADIPKAQKLHFMKLYGRPTLGGNITILVFPHARGEPILCCKVPREKTNALSLEREYHSLSHIRTRIRSTDILQHIPDVKFYGSVDDCRVLITSVAVGRSLRGLTKNRKIIERYLGQILAWLIDLSREYGITRAVGDVALLNKWFLKPLAFVREKSPEHFQKPNVARFFDTFSQFIEGKEIPLTLQHRDCNVHNIIVHQNSFMLIDWEDCEFDALPIFDFNHLFGSARFLLQREGSKHVGWLDALFEEKKREFLSALEIPEDLFDRLRAFYYIHVACKTYEPQRQEQHTAAEWLDRMVACIAKGA